MTLRLVIVATVALSSWAASTSSSTSPLASAPELRPLRGVALALHPRECERQGFEYPPDPAPLRALGANDVLLAPTWELASRRASVIERGEVADDDLRAVMRRSRALGLGVVLMPHLVVRDTRDGAWRGSLAPSEPERFWREYERFVIHYARLAHDEGARAFAIGSELSSLTKPAQRERWSVIAGAARRVYSGTLFYVANHDALAHDAPFEHVDAIGVSAYFPLTDDREAPESVLYDAWREHARTLRALRERYDRPLWIAELGYPSRDGAALRPWDDASPSPADPEEQRRAFAAARRALVDAGALAADGWLDGVVVWTWFGPGGLGDRHYTVRGKSAEHEVRALLAEPTRRHAATRSR